MTFYLILLSSLVGFGFLLKLIVPDKKLFDKLYLGVTFIVLTTVSSIRFAVGYDYLYIYVPAFDDIVGLSFLEIFTNEQRHELGYVLLQYLVCVISDDFRLLYFVTSFIIFGLVCLFFYKYSNDKILSVFLYISLGLFYSSMNFIRQNIAALLVSFAFMQIKEKKLLNFIILVIFAGFFHKSAFFMLPFYFVLQFKFSNFIIVSYCTITVLILLYSTPLIYFAVDKFFPWYLNNSINLAFIEQGIPWYYLIVPFSIFVFVYIYKNQFDDDEHFQLNISFFSLFFFVLGWKHFIIERFTLFFQFLVIILIGTIVSKVNSLNHYNLKFVYNGLSANFYKSLPYLVIFVLATGLHCLLLFDDGHSVLPYQTIFGELYNRYILIAS